MKRFNWQNIRLVLIISLMIFLYSFSLKKNANRIVNTVNISFTVEKDNLFITHEIVNNLLIQKQRDPLKVKKEDLNLKSLEKLLDNHEMIENAEVFSTINGSLNAQIKQKTPIVRYVSSNTMYYLDNKGDKMPLSENFSARVPIIFGDFDMDNKEEYVKLFNEIAKDDFLKKSITGIEISPSGNIVMTNRDYDFKILFGNPIHVNEKLKNYKAFYMHAIKDTLIKNYKSVNLLFTDQVVCKN
jgi:cell division protein FtsQ